MLNFEEIILFGKEAGLPAGKDKQALAEYLQCLILQIIARNENAEQLSFIGGTCLRFYYGLSRFSEDLDFDNFGITEQNFSDLIGEVVENLTKLGFTVDSVIKFKGAYHCYVRFNNLLYENKLSPHADEKILVKIDTVSQDFPTKREKKFFNRYGISEEVSVNALDFLMAQKTCALLERKRAKGRDFFDFIFLDGLTKPNMEYLSAKVGIKSPSELKERLLARCDEIDLKNLARDVEPFLFNPHDIIRITKFKQYIEGWKV